jgi:hypothetical protein
MNMHCRLLTSFFAVLVPAALNACRDAPLSENINGNMAPTAFAGETQTIDYSGSPITVTLDGSGSSDTDGTIVTYLWFSGVDAPDGGMGRSGPDPDDVMSPKVTLDAGSWAFTLFVFDNDGGVSSASTVTIEVGGVAITPEVTECVDAALPTIAEDCRLCLCAFDDACRTAITGCDQGCWDFFTCVQNSCGDISDPGALANCARTMCDTSKAAPFLALDPCVTREPACRQTCVASVKTM